MFKKQTKVLEKEGDKVIVSLARDSLCGCCSNMFCGAKKESKISLEDSVGLCVGDRVEIGISSKTLLFLSMIIFLMPSLVFIGTIYLSRSISPYAGFALAILMVCIYFIFLKFTVVDRLKDKLSCRIIRKVTLK